MFNNRIFSLESSIDRRRLLQRRYFVFGSNNFYFSPKYFDFFFWWLFRFVCILSFFPICYLFLRLFTYATDFGVSGGFFELVFSSIKFLLSKFYSISTEIIDKQFNFMKITFSDMYIKALKNSSEYEELADGSASDRARIFESSEYDPEDYFWIDFSNFDVWSYRLIDVPSIYFQDLIADYEGDDNFEEDDK
jgi:hypothetical protein